MFILIHCITCTKEWIWACHCHINHLEEQKTHVQSLKLLFLVVLPWECVKLYIFIAQSQQYLHKWKPMTFFKLYKWNLTKKVFHIGYLNPWQQPSFICYHFSCSVNFKAALILTCWNDFTRKYDFTGFFLFSRQKIRLHITHHLTSKLTLSVKRKNDLCRIMILSFKLKFR